MLFYIVRGGPCSEKVLCFHSEEVYRCMILGRGGLLLGPEVFPFAWCVERVGHVMTPAWVGRPLAHGRIIVDEA